MSSVAAILLTNKDKYSVSDKQNFVIPVADDRHSSDRQHILLTYVIHYYFDQQSSSVLLDLLDKYNGYSSNLLDVIQFVVVDDGSPLRFEVPVYNLNITWLRITDDIPWNQPGARNLGVTYAKSDKVLLADLDHEFPEHTLKKMTEMGRLGRRFYKIWKWDSESNLSGRPHPNTFLISRGRFLRLFGYDEEFCGSYGVDDYRFVKFQKYHGSWQRHLGKKYYCIVRKDINREIGYHSLTRDLSSNRLIDNRKRNELLMYGAESGHSRIFLNFHWKIIATYARKNRPVMRVDRKWKHFWWFRTIFGYYI